MLDLLAHPHLLSFLSETSPNYTPISRYSVISTLFIYFKALVTIYNYLVFTFLQFVMSPIITSACSIVPGAGSASLSIH